MMMPHQIHRNTVLPAGPPSVLVSGAPSDATAGLHGREGLDGLS